MVCVPAPAVEGENCPPLTPGPEYVPPEGEPPLRAKEGVVVQTELRDCNDIEGNAFTTRFELELALQPFAAVYEYKMECDPTPAFAGLNIPPDTPFPEYVPPLGEPPLSAKPGVLIQAADKEDKLTIGGGRTLTVT